MGLNEMLSRVARGGPNTRRRTRRSNRPRGEGKGLIPVVRSLFRRR
jgi:hypothetical protein